MPTAAGSRIMAEPEVGAVMRGAVAGDPDHAFMGLALRLARRGLYTTTPNPRVGCVVVRDGQVIGTGYHERAGGPHAEVHALQSAGNARGATVYISLEPCSHLGRTGPCCDALIQAGVARVVVAMSDPDPRVSGRGLQRLEAAGIQVRMGVMESEARALNVGFVQRMEQGRPWVRLKLAASLDGRTAMASGESQWITGAPARADVQRWRAQSCAVLTGVDTLLADDCQLTVRGLGIGRQPLRVVLDSHLRTPAEARLLRSAGPVLIVHAQGSAERITSLQAAGAELLQLPDEEGRVNLQRLMDELGQRGINEVLAETGATLAGALWQARLVDELVLYQAPTLLGSRGRPLLLMPLEYMADQQRLTILSRTVIGEDLRIIARPPGAPCSGRAGS